MARNSECRSILVCGLIAGLLVVAGCQNRATDGPVVNDQPAEAPVAVDGSEGEPDGADGEIVPPPTGGQDTGDIAEQEAAAAPKVEDDVKVVDLALRFEPGRVARYRVITEGYKSVEWKGEASAKPAWFANGRSGNRLEMTFDQETLEVKPEGEAIVAITIVAVKYVSDTPQGRAIDFDSQAAGASDHPMATLVGQSYRLEMSPKGQVLVVNGLDAVREALQGPSPAASAAVRLVSDDEARKRHSITPLALMEDAQVRPGQTWSDVRSFSFGDLGSRSYERIYTLSGVRRDDGRVAVVEMEGIPPAGGADATSRRHPMMMDSVGEYDGRLELDLDDGQVRQYEERMRTAWVMADPATVGGRDDLAALQMAATWLHRLERLE